ncbi:prophage regulatory protein [Variovorax paradoxus]|uniref:helix-turn-helix transcriptional regulator n=1 Tax=Variovorax atrisoli TaxID=3394203 RepID=UPI00119BF099|nr:AlpA family phage regulatory protein [Variovorax paradoxus]MDR6521812.1 prophage regulatory protein [Variovorax paradoxus]
MTARPLYLDKSSVAEFVALSVATIERLVRENEFPKPRVLSRHRVAWLVREVEEWAESRPASELPPPPNTGVKRRSSASARASAHIDRST